MTDFTFSLRSLVCGIALAGSMTVMADEGSIAFTIGEITSNDAVVSVKPSSDEITYYWNFMDKATFEDKGGAEKAIENRIAIWEILASNYPNTTWQEMMGYELQTGEMTESLSDYFYETLMYDTEYVVYAFGMDYDGNVTVPVSTAEFSTLPPIYSDNTFEVTITSVIKGGYFCTATAHVKPSNNDRYMARLFTKEFVDKFDIAPGSIGEKRFAAEEMLYYLKDDEITVGPHDFEFNRCYEGLEYCVVVMGLDENKSPSTSLTIAEFTTVEETHPIEGTLTLEVSDITPMNAHIRITPSDETIHYYYDVTTPEVIESKGGVANIPDKLIIDWWKYLAEIYGGGTKWQDFIEYQTRTGALDDMAANLIEEGELSDIYWDSEWVLYAVGFDLDGNVITEPAVLYFNTPPCGESDLKFDFEFVGAELDSSYPNISRNYYKVTVDIYPSDDEETYRANYMQTKFYDQYFEEEEPDMFDFITRQFLYGSVEFSGPVRLVMPGLPSTTIYGDQIEYYLMTMGWNEGPTTDVALYRFNPETSAIEIADVESVVVRAGHGTLSIEGKYDRAGVYSMDGRAVGALRTGNTLSLPAGIYVVRYTTLDGVEHTEKVAVN